MIQLNKNRVHQTSKIVKSRQYYTNGHLPNHFSFNLEDINIYYFPSCSGGAISLRHSFTPSLHHSFTPSLLHSFTPSLLHSFTPSLLHSFTPSLLHSFTPSLLHSFTPSLLHSFTPSLLHSFTPSLLHSFTPSLLHSFTPSLLHSFTPSLLHFPLDIWKPVGELPNEETRDARWKISVKLPRETNVDVA